MQYTERPYDKAIAHYQRLLADSGLTERDRQMFRRLLVRAVFQRAAARERIVNDEVDVAV